MATVKCEECQVGRCQAVPLTYMRRLGPHMVVMPNAPAYKCDMCGHVDFDPGFLLAMQTILEKLTKEPQRSDRLPASLTEQPQDWTPARSG